MVLKIDHQTTALNKNVEAITYGKHRSPHC